MTALASVLLAAGAVSSAAGMMSALGGCSFISGWSDLQTGTGDASPAKGGTGGDGSPGDPGSGNPDAATDGATTGTTDGSVGPGSGITCDNKQCAPGEGCCVAFDGPKACATTCDTAGGAFFLRCTSAASCDARTPICCFDYGTQTSTCAAGCQPGYPAICDAPPNTCPSGQSCTSMVAGVGNIRACK